jgi:hypothetical protein
VDRKCPTWLYTRIKYTLLSDEYSKWEVTMYNTLQTSVHVRTCMTVWKQRPELTMFTNPRELVNYLQLLCMHAFIAINLEEVDEELTFENVEVEMWPGLVRLSRSRCCPLS